MIQFHRYYLPHEPAYIRDLIIQIIIQLERKINDKPNSLVRTALNVLSISDFNPRVILIVLRLAFWKLVPPEILYSDVFHRLSDRFIESRNPYFLEEFSSCIERLGLRAEIIEKLNSEEFDNKYSAVVEQPVQVSVPSDFFTKSKDENEASVCYSPTPSGFFSLIENMLAARFLAFINGYDFYVEKDDCWWSYDTPFKEVFGSLFPSEQDRPCDRHNVKRPLRMLSTQQVRDRFDTTSISLLQKFRSYKSMFYPRIREQLLSIYCDFHIPVDSAILFIRGGDKVRKETIALPFEWYEEDLSLVLRQVRNIGVLSDDHLLAESLVSRFNHPSVHNLTSKLHRGYVFDQCVKGDTRSVIKNYLLLSSSPMILSCPSSNLSNAANWSNEALHTFHSRIFPVARYSLI